VKKPTIAKSLQFDAEPLQEGTSDSQSQSSERPVPSSLLHLIGQTAETAEEKYRLLEQRDKVMRQGEAANYCKGSFSVRFVLRRFRCVCVGLFSHRSGHGKKAGCLYLSIFINAILSK